MTQVTGIICQVTGILLIKFEVPGHMTQLKDFVFLIYFQYNRLHILQKEKSWQMKKCGKQIGLFLVIFWWFSLFFFVFPLTFGPCIIHRQKALAMRIPMPTSKSLQEVLVSVQIFVMAMIMKFDLQLKACVKNFTSQLT